MYLITEQNIQQNSLMDPTGLYMGRGMTFQTFSIIKKISDIVLYYIYSTAKLCLDCTTSSCK